MPMPRGTVGLSDEVDAHGEELVNLIELVEHVTGDGLVTPDESQLLRFAAVRTQKSFDVLPGRVSELDGVMRLIGCAAHAGRVSRKVRDIAQAEYLDTRNRTPRQAEPDPITAALLSAA